MVATYRCGVGVDFDCIGEGHNGDYDPTNPHDEALLRFTVVKAGPTGIPEPVDDGSYCTRIPASTPSDVQIAIVKFILERVLLLVLEERSIKHVCEELSWLTADMVDA